MLPKRFTFPSPGFSHYWNDGVGKRLLQKLGHVPDKEEVEDSAKLLWEFDSLADEVITEVYEKVGFHKANQMLTQIFEQGIDAVPNVPDCLQRLFSQVNSIPNWLDEDLLNAGSAFCRRVNVFGLIVLRNYCLMGGYESSAINKPLIYTEALTKGAAKRMAETVEFWVNVTGQGAMKLSAIGFQSAIKVRIMHAFARVSILKKTDWNNELWGVPINQSDMVATNIGFSLVFIEGLKKVGFSPTEKEIKGVLHLWKYIGFLLGIPPSYLPDTEEQAIAALYKWTISQPRADKDTNALALALMHEPTLASYPKYLWQKKLLVQIHLGYNHFFLDDRACKTIGLPKAMFRRLPYLATFLNKRKEPRILSKSSAYNYAVQSGRKYQEEVKNAFLRGHASLKQ